MIHLLLIAALLVVEVVLVAVWFLVILAVGMTIGPKAWRPWFERISDRMILFLERQGLKADRRKGRS